MSEATGLQKKLHEDRECLQMCHKRRQQTTVASWDVLLLHQLNLLLITIGFGMFEKSKYLIMLQFKEIDYAT